MMYFFGEKQSNLKRVGKVIMLDSSTLTPLLKKLEKKGYLIRKKSTKDERNLVLSLTEKGRELEEPLKKVPGLVRNMLNLTEDEINSLHMITYKILNQLMEE